MIKAEVKILDGNDDKPYVLAPSNIKREGNTIRYTFEFEYVELDNPLERLAYESSHRITKWHTLDNDVWFRELPNGYEFIQIVWLDTCPYDADKEYCICQSVVENKLLLCIAYDYFQENCLTDSYCVKGECNYKEAMKYVREVIK